MWGRRGLFRRFLKGAGPGHAGGIVDGIEDQLVRAVRLPAPLGLEAKQIDSPIALEDFERGDFPLNAFGVQQVPALQRIPVAGVSRQNRAAETALLLEDRSAFEHEDRKSTR